MDSIVNGFNTAVNFIKNLASQAFQWGADIIGGIVNGIRSCIGNVADSVTEVADTIRSFLHFSVSDEGPLTDFESWMPDFIILKVTMSRSSRKRSICRCRRRWRGEARNTATAAHAAGSARTTHSRRSCSVLTAVRFSSACTGQTVVGRRSCDGVLRGLITRSRVLPEQSARRNCRKGFSWRCVRSSRTAMRISRS